MVRCPSCAAPVDDADRCPLCFRNAGKAETDTGMPDLYDLVQHPENYDAEANRRRRQTARR